jgi:DNA-binding transcriptional ArsR family regulator
MIESVFGSLLKEKILVYITVNPESYPNEISRVFQSSLSSVQKHLENLEKNGIVVSRLKGKTRLYDLNPRSPFRKELAALLEKIYSFINENEKEKFFVRRSRPRRKGKPS